MMIEIKKAKLVFHISNLTNDGLNYVKCPCGWTTGSFNDMGHHLVEQHGVRRESTMGLKIEVLWWEHLYNGKGALDAKEAREALKAARNLLR